MISKIWMCELQLIKSKIIQDEAFRFINTLNTEGYSLLAQLKWIPKDKYPNFYTYLSKKIKPEDRVLLDWMY